MTVVILLVLCCFGIWYGLLFRRLVVALERLPVNNTYRIEHSPEPSGAPGLAAVPDLAPEVLAPYIVKPPRSRGGFGSRVE